MKNITRLITMIAFAVLAFVACHKEHQAVTKVIEVTINANETYTYSIPPTGDADDILSITTQGQHALSNTLAFTDNKHNSTFQYTPVNDFTGIDEVRVSTIENHQANNNQQGNGNCQGHHKDEGTTYIFRITVGSGNIPG